MFFKKWFLIKDIVTDISIKYREKKGKTMEKEGLKNQTFLFCG